MGDDIKKKYEVHSIAFNELILGQLSQQTLTVSLLYAWTEELIEDMKSILDVTIEEHALEIFPMPGSSINNVACACYNFAILFQKDVRCTFNGYTIEIYNTNT